MQISNIQSFINKKDYETAISLIESTPAFAQQADYLLALGRCYLSLQQIEKGISALNQAISLDANQAAAYFERGTAFMIEGKHAQAEKDFRQAIEISPKYEEAWLNLGINAYYTTNYKEALAAINHLISLNPDSDNAYYSRGNVYLNMSKIVEAEKDFLKALEISYVKPSEELPTDFILGNLGVICQSREKYVESLPYFDKAIEINPHYPLAYMNRALSFFHLKDYEKAEADFHKTLELDVNYAPAHLYYGKMLLEIGEEEDAQICFENVLVIDPENEEALELLK